MTDSEMELVSAELNNCYQEMAKMKATMVMCRITIDAILNSPDEAPLSIIRPYLQTRLDQINEHGF